MKSRKKAIEPYERPINEQYNPFRDYVRKNRWKKIRPIGAILILVIIWYIGIGKDIVPKFIENLKLMGYQKGVEKIYYKVGCSEANLARMIALTYEGSSEKVEKQGEDTTDQQALWYENYYKELGDLGITALDEKEAFNLISYDKLVQVFGQCFNQTIIDLVVKEQESYQVYEVIDFLKEALEKSGKGEIIYQDAAILATPSDDIPLGPWEVMTNEGNFYFEGLVVAPLKNKIVTLALSDNQLLGVTEIKSQTCEIPNCSMIRIDNATATYEVNGITFTYKNKILTQSQENSILTLTLQEDEIIDFKVSKEGDAISSIEGIQESNIRPIRVLLTNNEGKELQDTVELMANRDYEISYAGESTLLAAGQIWRSNAFDFKAGESCVRFIPKENSSLTLRSVTKSGRNPTYKGIIEVIKGEDGFKLINEIGIEDYVAGVLPSEMPESYGKEALKAQAVAIRTYAVAAQNNPYNSSQKIDVNDTTSFQVYNRLPSSAICNEVAYETAGLVLKSNGRFISNKFFATSCGFTANSGEVWMVPGKISHTPNYLIAVKQFEDDLKINNLSQEQEFEAFLSKTADELTAYDEASPWFRWQVTLTTYELQQLISPVLKKMATQNSPYAVFTSLEGKPLSGDGDIGTLKNIEVRERGEGGNIIKLAIIGSKAVAVIESEYYIRSLFQSNHNQSLNVERQDKSRATGLTLLPSAFFYLEKKYKENSLDLSEVTILGGGNGHGVGLSQDGARGMASKGYDFKEILAHYYPGTELINME